MSSKSPTRRPRALIGRKPQVNSRQFQLRNTSRRLKQKSEEETSLTTIFDGDDVPLMPLEKIVKRSKSIKKVKMELKRGITMDSGAHRNVMPRRMAGKRQMRQSAGSKRKMHYLCAGVERIANQGEIDFDFESVEGHKETFVFQIADVNKALGSVAYVVDTAFRVVYDKNMETGEDMSYMIHKPSKKSFRFRR